MLGIYQQIESDAWLIASTRSFNSSTAVMSAPKQEVLEAVQNRKFNKDDVDELKRDKVVGEGNKGFLAILGNDAYNEKADYKQFVDQIVAEENRDRQIIFERVLAVNTTAAQAGSAKVNRHFCQTEL